MADALTVDIVAPDHVMWSGTASRVIAPSVEGEIGLLASHEPILSILKAGTIRVTSESENREFAVTGGFVSFDHDTITIVADPVVTDED
ncbi:MULTISPECIES: F0F1 ATP synthase subunit epsilon [Demequina]|uniref:ATP synthase epsilon chain n=1 Tax=Demequina litorisediminis TaxID=1849022 RepID=A0ABQ6IHP1_9MICO|nr:F0F1 ATP synthase subunit epsilon [Demequina litorisediminis]GMA36677.1 F0F1 ATP synthase subunit epsilon [Demequina litorisediminis]